MRLLPWLLLLLPLPLSAQGIDSTSVPPHGDSMVVRAVELQRRDVFDPSETGFIPRLANALHIQTRAVTVRRELLFRPGEPYDSASVAESERNLRSLGIFRRVTIDSVRTDSGSGHAGDHARRVEHPDRSAIPQRRRGRRVHRRPGGNQPARHRQQRVGTVPEDHRPEHRRPRLPAPAAVRRAGRHGPGLRGSVRRPSCRGGGRAAVLRDDQPQRVPAGGRGPRRTGAALLRGRARGQRYPRAALYAGARHRGPGASGLVGRLRAARGAGPGAPGRLRSRGPDRGIRADGDRRRRSLRRLEPGSVRGHQGRRRIRPGGGRGPRHHGDPQCHGCAGGVRLRARRDRAAGHQPDRRPPAQRVRLPRGTGRRIVHRRRARLRSGAGSGNGRAQALSPGT